MVWIDGVSGLWFSGVRKALKIGRLRARPEFAFYSPSSSTLHSNSIKEIYYHKDTDFVKGDLVGGPSRMRTGLAHG